MTLKVILVPVTPTEAAESALHAGIALARRFQAHVVAQHVRSDPRNAMPYMGDGMSGIVVQEIVVAAERDSADRAKTCRAMFERVIGEEGVPIAESPGSAGVSASWEEQVGREDELVARRARLADLVLMQDHVQQRSISVGMTLEAALLDSGRPLLLVPPGHKPEFAGPIAIAWNGSAQAARAVASAMPLLALAPRVTALTVGEGEDSAALVRGLSDFLAWHGIRAETKVVAATDAAIGATLLGALGDCGLLVMGAYTHSRFREMVFGGVTRHILTHAPVPILVAH